MNCSLKSSSGNQKLLLLLFKFFICIAKNIQMYYKDIQREGISIIRNNNFELFSSNIAQYEHIQSVKQ